MHNIKKFLVISFVFLLLQAGYSGLKADHIMHPSAEMTKTYVAQETQTTKDLLPVLPWDLYDTAFVTAGSFTIEAGLKPISSELDALAKGWFFHLSESYFFDTRVLNRVDEVDERMNSYRHDVRNKGQRFSVKTKDGVTITGTFFNRGSEKLMVIGEGFTNPYQKMAPFLSVFPNYDIVLFDFRGQGIQKGSVFSTPSFLIATCAAFVTFAQTGMVSSLPKNLVTSTICGSLVSIFGVNPFNWSARLSKATFGVDSGLLTLGAREQLDVVAVVQEAKRLKECSNVGALYATHHNGYKQVYGLGVCYGAFIFAKTQVLYPGLFDKLILDSTWLDLPSVIAKLRKDLAMLNNPQKGGWSDVWPLNQEWCQQGAEFLASHVWGLRFKQNNSIEHLLPQLTNIPVLFFHGKDDLMVTRDEFSKIWSKTGSTQKLAIITSNEHVRNHLKQKELYTFIAQAFLDLEYEVCVSYLENTRENMDKIKKYVESKRYN